MKPICRDCNGDIFDAPYDVKLFERSGKCIECNDVDGMNEMVAEYDRYTVQSKIYEGIYEITNSDLPTLRNIEFSRVSEESIRDNFRGKGGLYAFYNIAGELLYIGKSVDIARRLYSHQSGKSNSKGFSDDIHSVGLILCENRFLMEIYETYLINVQRPLENKDKNYYSEAV